MPSKVAINSLMKIFLTVNPIGEICRKYPGADELFLKDRYKIKKIFGMTVSDVVYSVWWDWKPVFSVFLFRSSLHDTFYAFYDIVNVCEVTFAITIVKNLNSLSLL